MVYKAKLKFSEAMLKFGLIPPNNIIADGKVHLCKYNKDGSFSESGWYIFSKIKPETGLYGCFDINKKKRWANVKTDSLDKDDKLNYLKRIYKFRTVLHKFKIDNGMITISDFTIEKEVDTKEKYLRMVVRDILKNCERKHTKPRCNHCDLKDCRYQIANNIYNKYGDESYYRVETFQLGIAMGLADPGKKYKQDNEEQKKKYIAARKAVKSQFGRWKKSAPSPKNVTL